MANVCIHPDPLWPLVVRWTHTTHAGLLDAFGVRWIRGSLIASGLAGRTIWLWMMSGGAGSHHDRTHNTLRLSPCTVCERAQTCISMDSERRDITASESLPTLIVRLRRPAPGLD